MQSARGFHDQRYSEAALSAEVKQKLLQGEGPASMRHATIEEARKLQELKYHEAALAAKKKKEEREREKMEKKWARYQYLNQSPGHTLHPPTNTTGVRSTLNDAQKDVEMKTARMKLQERYQNIS